MKIRRSVVEKIQRTFLLRRAVQFVWQCAPGWTIASVVLLFVQGVLPLLSLYLMKMLIDTVSAGLASPDKNIAYGQVLFYAGSMGLVSLITSFCSSIASLVNETQSLLVTDYMNNILHAKSVEADLAYYENPQYYDTLHRAQQEAASRPTHIVQGLVQLAQGTVSVTALAGLLFTLHWLIAIILVVSVIPSIFVRLFYSQQTFKWQRKRTPTERYSWYYHWLLTSDTPAKEIRLFDLGHLFMQRYRDLRQKLRVERLGITKKRSRADFITQFSTIFATYGTFAFVAYRTMLGKITMGDLVLYYQAFQRGQSYVREILGSLAGLYEDSLFLSNLYEFLDLKPSVADPPNPKTISKLSGRGIEFQNIHFQYPGTSRNVLENVNITIKPGEHIALVGENGSGKTTLIKLLCRLYDPTQGCIRWNGTDIREFLSKDLRKEIGVIFQDYVHYFFSVRDNIWFANLTLSSQDESIYEAARNSGADEVIKRLPHGYDTLLGKWFDEGQELSIGEWQKVALARVFLRQAQLVVLDEPTSSLDAKAEYEVFKKFSSAMHNRSAILISHRLSTARLADRIYVMRDGSVSEHGTHEELMRLGGKYAYLFDLQAKNYR